MEKWRNYDLWYPKKCVVEYGPKHEQDIRKTIADSAKKLTQKWEPHCGLNDRLSDRRDIGQRAQFRAEIDAYISHLFGLTKNGVFLSYWNFSGIETKRRGSIR